MGALEELDLPIRKLKTDEGVLFSKWSRGIDSFVSPAFDTPEGIVSWLRDELAVSGINMEISDRSSELMEELDKMEIYQSVTREAMEAAQRLILKLQGGEPLEDQEAYQLNLMIKFIEGVLAFDDNEDIEIDFTLLEEWIDANNMRDDYKSSARPEVSNYSAGDLLDRAQYNSYQGQSCRVKYPNSNFGEEEPSTKNERMLVGLYLSNLFLLAKAVVQNGWEKVLANIDLKNSFVSVDESKRLGAD
ncbi:MAG: hypothetical protein NTZ25_05145 [Candidatus Peregrinibacteria bacterium]|nr:hypothetical protein [Candidatus Peregrinibacteria bacterium]